MPEHTPIAPEGTAPPPGGPAGPPEALGSGMDLDPELAARRKAARLKELRTQTVPKLRLVGFGLMLLLIPIHNAFFLGDPSWGIFGRMFGFGVGLALVAWGLLYRFYDLAWRGLTLDDLFLVVDMVMVSLLVYFTGADRSLLFPLYLFRVGDQTHTTFPRAIFFTHLVTAAYLGVIAWAVAVDGHAVSWGQQATKVVLLYATGFYISLTTREAERLRRSLRESIQMTREFSLRLVAQAEELQAAKQGAEDSSRAKSAFLAATSHDLRTPLNAILLYSELLREDAEAAGQEETVQDLKKIHSAGQHLLQLLNDLLDLAKVEAGKMSLYLEEVGLPVFLEEVRNLASPLMSQKGNTFRVEIDPALGALVTDATRLRQILLNLLSNAAKFTEAGTISLSVHRAQEPSGEWMVAEVRDTGIGMSPDQLGRLFQEFTQAEDSTTKKFGGTGLGLVLCQRLCGLLGGAIQVDSTLGEGSTFTVRLPWKHPAGPASPAPVHPPRPAAAPDQPRKVLIIDDDGTFRAALGRVFHQEGFDVVEASSGEEGLRLAREVQPSLITLDVVMPGIDGWTVLRTFKSDPDLAAIPVILVTLADDRSQGFALGATEYLPKPIEPRRFQDVLRRIAPERGSLLVVEDDEAQRQAFTRLLEGAGWRIQTAGHGQEALELLEAGLLPDLILLDLQMPRMDGFQFMDRLRGQASWRSLPVVVLTSADLSPEARTELARHDVEQILSKTGHPKEKLLEVVRDLAKGAAPRA